LISRNKGTHLIWEELDPARLYIDLAAKLGASLGLVEIEPVILLVRALVPVGLLIGEHLHFISLELAKRVLNLLLRILEGITHIPILVEDLVVEELRELD
jgi:hypothetical protein